MKTMKRKQLSKKEIKEMNAQLVASYGLDNFISKKDDVFVAEGQERVLYVNSRPLFFYSGEKLVPMLKLILRNNFLKIIVIDMPAVKFVANGADVMRPGIKEIEDGIKKGEIVAVVDETHKKPIAIGVALMSTEDMKSARSGKAIKSLHYVGDRIWNMGGF